MEPVNTMGPTKLTTKAEPAPPRDCDETRYPPPDGPARRMRLHSSVLQPGAQGRMPCKPDRYERLASNLPMREPVAGPDQLRQLGPRALVGALQGGAR